ncbi:hypothetical protein ElyMa_005516200, partial [Elysia marginata]
CGEAPISLKVLEARWRLFGHLLRRDPNIPASEEMHFYYWKTAPEEQEVEHKRYSVHHKPGNNITERPGCSAPPHRESTEVDRPHGLRHEKLPNLQDRMRLLAKGH